MTVVDPKCKVIGIESLRVADSSIFPHITNGNLNAPSIMTGEKRQTIFYGGSHLQLKFQSPGYTHHGKQIKDKEEQKRRA